MPVERLVRQEQPQTYEHALQTVLTPTTARFLFDVYQPDAQTATPAQVATLRSRTERDLSSQTAEAVLLLNRAQHQPPGSYTERLRRSNEKLHAWVEYTETQSPEREAALKSLGIDQKNHAATEITYRKKLSNDNGEKEITETITLFEEVERFRERFFGNNGEKNALGDFVQALADGTRLSPNEPVDLPLLIKRLDAVHAMFPLFGERTVVEVFVKNYVASYALLSQQGEAREQMITRATAAFAEQVTDQTERKLLHVFVKRQEKEEILALQESLDQAKQEALTTAVLEQKKEREAELYRHFLHGDISLEQFHERLTKLDDTTPGLMVFTTREAFQRMLHLANPKTDMQEITAHEQAHFQKAEEYGLAPKYSLQVTRNDDGSFQYHPATIYSHPLGKSPEEIKQIYHAILAAPEHLSRYDQQALQIPTPQT